MIPSEVWTGALIAVAASFAATAYIARRWLEASWKLLLVAYWSVVFVYLGIPLAIVLIVGAA